VWRAMTGSGGRGLCVGMPSSAFVCLAVAAIEAQQAHVFLQFIVHSGAAHHLSGMWHCACRRQQQASAAPAIMAATACMDAVWDMLSTSDCAGSILMQTGACGVAVLTQVVLVCVCVCVCVCGLETCWLVVFTPPVVSAVVCIG
jgi:hypothetical protein